MRLCISLAWLHQSESLEVFTTTLLAFRWLLESDCDIQNTPIFKAAIDIINHSPLALKLLGSQIRKVGLARGSTKDGFARITFVVNGANGEYLVTLTGTCSKSEDYEIDTLSMHKRSSYPVNDIYIYKDKVLQSNVESVEETSPELVE